MSCWHGHVPRMTEAQLRQAMEAYYEAYAQDWQARWQQSPWTCDLRWEPPEPPRQYNKRQPALVEARPGDKVDAIDVEFRRVR